MSDEIVNIDDDQSNREWMRGHTDTHSAHTHPDTFAADRGSHAPGRKSATISAVNEYQDELADAYGEWCDGLARDLARGKDDFERTTILEDAIGLLLMQLTTLGRSNLTAAWQLALDGNAPTPDMVSELQDAINENDQYLSTSLIPDLRDKLMAGLRDPDILAALALSKAAFVDAISGLLDTMNARVESYAGTFWATLMVITGMVAQELGQRIYWKRDNMAQHCATCLEFGDQMYDSMDDLLNKTGGITPANGTDCNNNCRCTLVPMGEAVMAMFSVRQRSERFYNQNHDERGRFGSGGGGSGGGETLPYIMQDSPTANTNTLVIQDANLPDSHTDGIGQIKFIEGQNISSINPKGERGKALGTYDPVTREIMLSSNADNISVIGGAVVLHEIGHNVHIAKMTDETADEWAKLSDNGKRCVISAYGRSNQGEHFAEAYRLYVRGGKYRSRLRSAEPDVYKFMAKVYRGKGLLPAGVYSTSNWRKRYDPTIAS